MRKQLSHDLKINSSVVAKGGKHECDIHGDCYYMCTVHGCSENHMIRKV